MERDMRKQYTEASDDECLKIVVEMQRFLNTMVSRGAARQEILKEAARFIFHTFGFKEVAICICGEKDKKFRYEGFLGLTRDVEQSYKQLAYDYNIVFDDDKYPGIKVSKFTELMPAEMEPYEDGEESTYNRPTMITAERRSASNMVDGDYYAIYLTSKGNEIIGWLELSAHKDGKFPSMKNIKGLELFATVLATMVWRG